MYEQSGFGTFERVRKEWALKTLTEKKKTHYEGRKIRLNGLILTQTKLREGGKKWEKIPPPEQKRNGAVFFTQWLGGNEHVSVKAMLYLPSKHSYFDKDTLKIYIL